MTPLSAWGWRWTSSKVFKGGAIRPLLESAWLNRTSAEGEMRLHVLLTLGMLAGQAGDHSFSLQAFDELDRLAPSDEAKLNGAVALGALGRYEEAVARARKCDPAHPRCLTILANLLRGAGQTMEAFATYLKAIEV